MSRSFALLSLGVVALGVAVRRTAPATIEAPPAASAAPATRRIWAEGRVVSRAGAEVTVAPEIAGRIVRLAASEKSAVKKGDLLLELASDDHVAALAEARARVVEAEADIAHLEVELERATKLAAAELLTAQALQRTRHDLELARARRATAEAAAAHAALLIERTRLVAPIDGVVVKRFVQPGETVLAGARVATIVDLASVRVEAEVDEFDAVGLEPGAPAVVSAEGHARSWQARVEELPDVIVARTLEREGPGEPQGTHVLLAKIALAERTPLRIGQRVEVNIELAVEAPAPAVVAPPPAVEAPEEKPVAAESAPLPRPAVEAPSGELATAVSTALTIASATLVAFAVVASRRSVKALRERRIVRLGRDGVMGDHDVLLARHATERHRARVELEVGGAIEFEALAEDGVEARPDGVELTIEGVPVTGPTVLVHGMVIAVATGDEPACYVYLDRAASHSEQMRVWLEPDASFRTAEGDSIADVWSEDEIYVFDDSNARGA